VIKHNSVIIINGIKHKSVKAKDLTAMVKVNVKKCSTVRNGFFKFVLVLRKTTGSVRFLLKSKDMFSIAGYNNI